MENIRNFVIIAHVDHGKSTLADRFLETTGTVEKRKMKEQYLDQLELERERGITIKMAPVRMVYHAKVLNSKSETLNDSLGSFVLNLIDTPGHSDFSYEVSRALAAVHGAVVLVDVTQGIQAQTLAHAEKAKESGLTLVGAVNKIDVRREGVEALAQELAELIGEPEGAIHRISGKTGEGVEGLLQSIVAQVPPPSVEPMPEGIRGVSRALIFDSFYDSHKGIIASVRVVNGAFKAGSTAFFIATETPFAVKEVGVFSPQMRSADTLMEGEIGYLATGLKDPGKIKIGDTVVSGSQLQTPNFQLLRLPGYREPKPVVFVSFYPENPDEYDLLKTSLDKLKLNDSSLTVEPDANEVLGRGIKVGFLGRLHFEITAERLEKEFNIRTVHTFPSVKYRVKTKDEWVEIVHPGELPVSWLEIWEPMVALRVMVPTEYTSAIFKMQVQFRFQNIQTEVKHTKTVLTAFMPLAELVSDFDDQLKSLTHGYGSFSYEEAEYKRAEVVKAEFLVAGEVVPGLSRFFPRNTVLREARNMVLRLKELLPRQQFAQAVQASAEGKIIAREDIPALRKDVTGYLYGGDRTRKMKLWQKQKRGKEKLEGRAEVKISPEVFRELLKK